MIYYKYTKKNDNVKHSFSPSKFKI